MTWWDPGDGWTHLPARRRRADPRAARRRPGRDAAARRSTATAPSRVRWPRAMARARPSSRTSATGSGSASTRTSIRDAEPRAGRGRADGQRRALAFFTTTSSSRRPAAPSRARGIRTSPTTASTATTTSPFGSLSTRLRRENTLEFVAGSHASGTWYMPRTFISQTALVFDEGELADVPDIEADRSAHEIVGWELEPGDAVAFHMLTLHQAGGSPTLRRAFSVRVLGDDATYAPRPHPTSPPFPGLDAELAAGDAIRRAEVSGALRGRRACGMRGARAGPGGTRARAVLQGLGAGSGAADAAEQPRSRRRRAPRRPRRLRRHRPRGALVGGVRRDRPRAARA